MKNIKKISIQFLVLCITKIEVQAKKWFSYKKTFKLLNFWCFTL